MTQVGAFFNVRKTLRFYGGTADRKLSRVKKQQQKGVQSRAEGKRDEGRGGTQSRALFKEDIIYQRQGDEMRETESTETGLM